MSDQKIFKKDLFVFYLVTSFILCILLEANLFARDLWTLQSPKPVGSTLVKIRPVDVNTVFATGYHGNIIFSENGGADWTFTKLPGNSSLRDVYFLDKTTGWTINKNFVFATTDGGHSWAGKRPAIGPKSPLLRNIFFYDKLRGWLLTDCGPQKFYENPGASGGMLYLTKDGGETWSKINLGTTGRLLSMNCPNNSCIFIVEEKVDGYHLIRSVNSGKTWVRLPLPQLINDDAGALIFLDSEFGYWGRFQTKDGGESWENQGNISSDYDIKSVYFIDAAKGWMIAHYLKLIDPIKITYTMCSKILTTSDGGENWTVQEEDVIDWLYDIKFYNEKNGWACGARGALYRTIDGGGTWELLTQGTLEILGDICVVDDSNGWCVGDRGTIIHTRNAGVTWSRQNSTTQKHLKSISFTDSVSGWTAGENIILHTSDAGNNWQVQLEDETVWLRDIRFVNKQTGWAVGEGGVILKTESGGKVWERQHSGVSNTLAAVFFLDESRGWVCGSGGIVLDTEDGGKTWFIQMYQGWGFLRNLLFIDRNYGWCSDGDDNNFYRTVDGGKNWEKIPYKNYYAVPGFNTFHFFDRMNGIAGGFLGGIIAKTFNGGQTWHFEQSLCPMAIQAFAYNSANQGWAISGNSIFYNSHTGFLKPDTGETEGQVMVFPNPVHGQINIYLDLPQYQHIRIELYNIRGEYVALVFEGKLGPPGAQLVPWYSNLTASGIYFLRIEGEQIQQVVRFTFVK